MSMSDYIWLESMFVWLSTRIIFVSIAMLIIQALAYTFLSQQIDEKYKELNRLIKEIRPTIIKGFPMRDAYLEEER